MMSLRTYTRLPSIQNGYELDDQFSVVVPVARTNLVINPSFETNTTGWTAIGGSIARSTVQQYHGAYSLAITPTAATTDGARFDTVSLTTGVTYAYSAKVLGIAGKSYKLAIETTAGVELTSVTFVATGRWQWIVGYYAETSTTTRRVTLRKAGGTDVLVFYLDGVQVEALGAGEIASTYLDGDQLGFVPNQSPPAYLWNGTPHASTSTRSGLTRAGGMVVKFRDFGFLLTAIIGLGLALPSNVATEYARLDGGYDVFTRKPTRQFTLSGQFQGGLDYLQLRGFRGGLARLLDRDLIGQDQRLLLRREVVDPCGVVQTGVCQVVAKYQGGLEGNADNQIAEQAAITFTQYMPNVQSDGEAGAALTVQLSVSNANAILQRSPAGVWSAMGTGMSLAGTVAVNAIVRGLDGTIYAAGTFTDAGGSGADYIAQWNGSAWSTLGGATAMNNTVTCLAIGPDGALYAGGYFTNAGGVAAADGIAKWNGSAWSALGTGTNAGGNVFALAFGPNGTLYAGGDFTLMGGVANTVSVAKWNGTAWSAMGSGVGANSVFALATTGSTVYAGGDFINMGGVAAADGIAKWNGTAWSALSTGATQINALAIAPSGILYVGGSFTTIGGVAATYLASWNGTQFSGLGTLDVGDVLVLAVDAQGVLRLGGGFGVINGVPYPDHTARYINGNFTPDDVDLPGVTLLHAILPLPDGTLYFGFQPSGTAIAAANTTITNVGTAKSYPVITIKGPTAGTSRIYSIVNYTTNRSVYLNLTLSTGETATLVFQPDSLSFKSDFQGNIASAIMPGSNVADFFLQPGANALSFFSVDSSVVATLRYRPAYLSMDDVP